MASENVVLLGFGLVAGLIPALLAIAPALRQRGGVPLLTGVVVAAVLLLVGALVSSAAVAAIRRLPLLAALRSE
jgi:hypothetical protein